MSAKPPSGYRPTGTPEPRSFADNLPNLKDLFPEYPDDIKWKASKRQRIGVIESEDPVATANQFAEAASKGAPYEKPLKNGYSRFMDDGTFVVFRESSNSDGSPAVSLDISDENHVRKIHFEQRGE